MALHDSSFSGKPSHKENVGVKRIQRKQSNLETKLKIIELLEDEKPVMTFSRFLNVPESTTRTIRRGKDRIDCALSSAYAGINCRFKDVDLVNTESLLLLWIDDQTERQVILNPVMVRKKAVEIYHHLTKGRPNDQAKFLASIGWYKRFRQRHDLSSKVTGHAAFDVYHQVANARFANLFIYDFNRYIELEQYRPDQIFCVKETKLFWKKIPGDASFKPATDRMTLILCSNMAANIRCKPTVILSMDPYTTLHPNDCPCCVLPVNWYAKGTTWMNSSLFQEWLERLFVPEVEFYPIPFKILLLLDKAPSHQDLPEIPNVNLMYLPPNTDSLINPMNHGIISEFQTGYLKRTLEALLEVVDTQFHTSLEEVWKNFGKNDAIDLISQTWNGISEATMKEAWAHISEKEEDTLSRETRMANTIRICLQLHDNLVGRNHSNISEAEIQEFLTSHNQEVSIEELADLCDMVPIEMSDQKTRINANNGDEESNEYIDPTSKIESSSELIEIYNEKPQNEFEDTITERIKVNSFGNTDLETVNLEPVEIEDFDEESKKSVGNPITDSKNTEDQEGEVEDGDEEEVVVEEEEEDDDDGDSNNETEHERQLAEHVSDEESKESRLPTYKIESSDMIEISDEEPQNEYKAMVTKRIALNSSDAMELETGDLEHVKSENSDEESQAFFDMAVKDRENVCKIEKQEDLDLDLAAVAKMENKSDSENNSKPVDNAKPRNPTDMPTIAHLQRLTRLTHQLIAKSRENDTNSARRDQFIADVEEAMRPYEMLLNMKLGDDELW